MEDAGDPERDPDYVMYGHFPESRGELLRIIVFYFSGLPAVVQRLRQMRLEREAREGEDAQGSDVAHLAATQLLVLGGFALVAGLPTGLFL